MFPTGFQLKASLTVSLGQRPVATRCSAQWFLPLWSYLSWKAVTVASLHKKEPSTTALNRAVGGGVQSVGSTRHTLLFFVLWSKCCLLGRRLGTWRGQLASSTCTLTCLENQSSLSNRILYIKLRRFRSETTDLSPRASVSLPLKQDAGGDPSTQRRSDIERGILPLPHNSHSAGHMISHPATLAIVITSNIQMQSTPKYPTDLDFFQNYVEYSLDQINIGEVISNM